MQSYLLLAQDIIERVPAVFAALQDGRIDLPRAEAFSDALLGLSDDKARKIVDQLMAKAEQWTPAILRERLRYHVLKADPSLARERYQQSVSDRRAYLQQYSNGTAELGATDLPPDKAAAAFNRVDRMARAAKSSGDVRNLSQLRADAILDLLSGRPFVRNPSLDNVTAQADQAARDSGLSDQDNDLRNQPGYRPVIRHRRGTLEPRKRSRDTGARNAGDNKTDKADGKAGNDKTDGKSDNGKADNRSSHEPGAGKADAPTGRSGTDRAAANPASTPA